MPRCVQTIAHHYHGCLGPTAILLLLLSATDDYHFRAIVFYRDLGNMRHAKDVIVLQVVSRVSHAGSVVYIGTGLETEIFRLWRLVVAVDLVVSAVINGEHISILRSHVVVRGRPVQAEDTDECGRKTLA